MWKSRSRGKLYSFHISEDTDSGEVSGSYLMVAILDFRIEQVIIFIFLEKATLLYAAVIVTAIFDPKSNGILYGNPFHLIPCIWKHIHRVKYHGSMLNTK